MLSEQEQEERLKYRMVSTPTHRHESAALAHYTYTTCEELTPQQLQRRADAREARDPQWCKEYELIKLKQSKLPSAQRKRIVAYMEGKADG